MVVKKSRALIYNPDDTQLLPALPRIWMQYDSNELNAKNVFGHLECFERFVNENHRQYICTHVQQKHCNLIY